MRELSYRDYVAQSKKKRILEATINLTYRCNLNCVHCFTNIGTGRQKKELSFREWKEIMDEIARAGCLWITFSGGEPLLHKDFSNIYTYVFRKGFKVVVFTNATLITPEIMRLFCANRPFCVEVSLYGVSRLTYESITQVPGSFKKATSAIRRLAAAKIPLMLKTVGLQQNKKEILKIKTLAEKLLGKARFKFDSFISPRLDGDTTPCSYRLMPQEILSIEEADEDMMKQRRQELNHTHSLLRPKDFLYQCDSWKSHFFISPYGRLQFCALSLDYSSDLTRTGFKKAFFEKVPRLLKEKFRTDSPCRSCLIRDYCYYCPARAFLETDNREKAPDYFCQLAELRKGQLEALAHRRRGG